MVQDDNESKYTTGGAIWLLFEMVILHKMQYLIENAIPPQRRPQGMMSAREDYSSM